MRSVVEYSVAPLTRGEIDAERQMPSIERRCMSSSPSWTLMMAGSYLPRPQVSGHGYGYAPQRPSARNWPSATGVSNVSSNTSVQPLGVGVGVGIGVGEADGIG